jgi:hypothetical protein
MEKLSMVCRFKTEHGKSLSRLLLCLGTKKEKEHHPMRQTMVVELTCGNSGGATGHLFARMHYYYPNSPWE